MDALVRWELQGEDRISDLANLSIWDTVIFAKETNRFQEEMLPGHQSNLCLKHGEYLGGNGPYTLTDHPSGNGKRHLIKYISILISDNSIG
ncbi:jg2274 [Pararge aegeria aegeria]|uniref:Jg2274 protein n=1 Tax=Pararge aegeria aegeria TaxID=348720 RepID=A0A8S4RT20_9NEOP|nr:jg2274 [Pararge aegeria aegeria]